jgi:hypothetical protein
MMEVRACAVVTPHSFVLEKRKHGTKAYGATYCLNDLLAKGLFENIT